MRRLKFITVTFFVIFCLVAIQIFQDWSFNIRRLDNDISHNPSNFIKGTTRLLQTLEPIKSTTSLQRTTSIKRTTSVGPLVRNYSIKFNISNSNLKLASKITPRIQVKTSKPQKDTQVIYHLISKNYKLLPVIKKEKVKRILLVTYFRGGSTFLGDILQQNWKTFYHFEPLHLMSSNSRIDKNETKEALHLLSNLFRCNFSATNRYNRWASIRKHQFLFKRNKFLWSTCSRYSVLCFNSQYLTNICIRSSVQVMKVTRLHLKDALTFLKNNSDLNIKLIYLSRDPRGIISSRKVLDWCQKGKCNNSTILCKEMKTDFEELQKFNASHQWIRYEDLSLNTENITRNLYKWLALPFTSRVATFLYSHTSAKLIDTKDPYSTRRNSSTAPFEWLHRLSSQEINNIQTECKKAMNNLGYKYINSTYLDSINKTLTNSENFQLNNIALY